MFQFRFQVLDVLLCRFDVVRRFASVAERPVALGRRLRGRSAAIGAIDGRRHLCNRKGRKRLGFLHLIDTGGARVTTSACRSWFSGDLFGDVVGLQNVPTTQLRDHSSLSF